MNHEQKYNRLIDVLLSYWDRKAKARMFRCSDDIRAVKYLERKIKGLLKEEVRERKSQQRQMF